MKENELLHYALGSPQWKKLILYIHNLEMI